MFQLMHYHDRLIKCHSYGARGKSIICYFIQKAVPVDDVLRKDVHRSTVKGDWIQFVLYYLVPDVTLSLVKEDKCCGNKEAFDIIKEPTKFGLVCYPYEDKKMEDQYLGSGV